MLSLIKAHCFRIKGDWYLVFPHGELAASWFLPAALLKWYIRLEIGLGLLSAVFVILALQSATIGNPAALVAAFLAVVVLVGRYLGVPYFFHHLGGVPAPYTFESLKMRGYTVLGDDNIISRPMSCSFSFSCSPFSPAGFSQVSRWLDIAVSRGSRRPWSDSCYCWRNVAAGSLSDGICTLSVDSGYRSAAAITQASFAASCFTMLRTISLWNGMISAR